MAYSTEMFFSAIVAVGRFTPAIFTPDWLRQVGLIGDQDVESIKKASNLVISQQVSVLESEWFVLQVLENQISLTGKGVVIPALRDLIAGILEVLTYTPVEALGLNFVGHFKIIKEEDYHRLGDVLAPKNIWNEIYDPDSNATGMASLTMLVQDGPRSKPKSGDQKRITVKKSDTIDNQGVEINYNDHHEAISISSEARNSAVWAVDVINKNWESSWKDADRAFKHLLDRAIRS